MAEIENAAQDVAAVIANQAQEIVADQREAETRAEEVQTAIVEAAIHTAQQERIANIENDFTAHKSAYAEREAQWREQINSLTMRLENLETNNRTSEPATTIVVTEPPIPTPSPAQQSPSSEGVEGREAPDELPPPVEPAKSRNKRRRFLL